MRPNQGRRPRETDIIDPVSGEFKGYHKVHVILRNGLTSYPTGPWPAAGGKPPTVWSIDHSPFDILEWEIAQ